MSIESAKIFMQRIMDDKELREKLLAAKDRDARLAIAKAEGCDFSTDEFASVAEMMDDKELDAVIGGSEKGAFATETVTWPCCSRPG